MIINALCNSCFQPYALVIQEGERELIAQISEEGTCPCPRLCGGRINLFKHDLIKAPEGRLYSKPMPITGKELYQAVNGTGLPDEIVADPAVVDALLRTHKIGAVDIEEHGGRLFIHELHLENGSVIHLSSGARGAQVLKITRQGAHT